MTREQDEFTPAKGREIAGYVRTALNLPGVGEIHDEYYAVRLKNGHPSELCGCFLMSALFGALGVEESLRKWRGERPTLEVDAFFGEQLGIPKRIARALSETHEKVLTPALEMCERLEGGWYPVLPTTDA